MSGSPEKNPPAPQPVEQALTPPVVEHTPRATSAVPMAHRRGLWLLAAALTCPCHLPIYALLLSGSALGALLADHMLVSAAVMGAIFTFSLMVFLRRA